MPSEYLDRDTTACLAKHVPPWFLGARAPLEIAWVKNNKKKRK